MTMETGSGGLRRYGSSPYLLGTGSTGMLLISSKPVGDSLECDRTSNVHAHTSALPSYPRPKILAHSRDTDNGTSNGSILSPPSRYQSNGLDISRTSNRYNLNTSLNDSLHDGDLSTSDLRASRTTLARPLSATHDLSASLSRLNTTPDKLSSSKARTGTSSFDSGRGSRGTSPLDRGDLQQALDDSEDRRQILVDRLKDAQDTIKLQSRRLTEIEESSRETSNQLEDMRFKEKEYLKKIAILDREKTSYHDKHMDGVKARETSQQRIDSLVTELSALRTTTDLVQSDMTRKEALIKQTSAKVAELEDQNNKLLKSKETLAKEATALRQSLELSKSRTDYLESHGRDTIDGLTRLKEETFQLTQDKTKLSQKVASLENKNFAISEENKTISMSVEILSKERHQLSKRVTDLEATVADLKSTLANTSSDKERFFQQKMELATQLQNATFEKDSLTKTRNSLEEQICELNAELSKLRRDMNRSGERKRHQDDELTASKRAGEVLTAELSEVRQKLDKATEQNQSLEHTKLLAFQQHELYEKEISSLETQLRQTKHMLTAMKEEHGKDIDGSEQQVIKAKEEIKDLKTQRNQLELKCHETEAKLRQSEQNLKSHSEDLTAQLQQWKDQCESLTSSNSRRELEIQSLNHSLEELEEEMTFLRDNTELYRLKLEDMTETKEDAENAREETRRLLQERAENQQVIQLLEMQKSILAKTTEGSLSKIQDSQQLQYQVEQLTIEKQHLEERISILEGRLKETSDSRDNNNKTDDLADMPLSARERLCELETQNHQLRALNNRITEQLTRVEQENVEIQTKYKDCIPKMDLKSVEREKQVVEESLSHLRSQYSKLQDQYEEAVSSEKARATDTKGLRIAQQEKEALEKQVDLTKSQLSVLEQHKKKADDKNVQLQQQLDAVHEKLFTVCQDENAQVLRLQKQVNNLTAELEESKRLTGKQDTMLQSLKEELDEEKTKKPSELTQSLDAVGEDLTAVRAEVTQLGEVIQEKDCEIEQLEVKLHAAKELLNGRDQLPTGAEDSGLAVTRHLKAKVEELEDENEELSARITKLKRERDLSVQDSEDLRDELDDLQKVCQDDHTRALDKMRKELSAKDRQIESLEEQLRHNTNMDIKKLKRGASKVDLLKAENRRLQSQLKPPTNHLPRFVAPPEDSAPDAFVMPQDPETPPTTVQSRLQERLQGGGLTPSQRLLNSLGDSHEVQDSPKSSKEDPSSWDESSDDDEKPDPSTNLLDDLNNQSMSFQQSRSTEDPQGASDFVKRSWQKLGEDELCASSKTLRRSLDLSSLRKNGSSKGEGSKVISPRRRHKSNDNNKYDDESSTKPILKSSSRYDLLDPSSSASYKREAFHSPLSKVDFTDPPFDSSSGDSGGDLSPKVKATDGYKGNVRPDSSWIRNSSSDPLRIPKPEPIKPTKGSSYVPKLSSNSPLTSVRGPSGSRLGKLVKMDNLVSNPRPVKPFPWQSKT